MIQVFITYLYEVRGYSERTCDAYRQDLEHFARWAKCQAESIRWSTLTTEQVTEYVKFMTSEGMSAATSNRHLASLSSLYRYFMRNGKVQSNPVRYMERKKLPKQQPNTIPVADLQTAYEHAHGVVKVMIGLLYATGIRIQELLDIHYCDIIWEENTICIHGKGSKARRVYAADEYLQTLHEVYNMTGNRGKVFDLDQRTARHMIWEALKPYSNAPQLSPHAIRHTFATELAKKGTNVATIANILGHEQILTTQKYINMADLPAKAVCLKLNTLSQ